MVAGYSEGFGLVREEHFHDGSAKLSVKTCMSFLLRMTSLRKLLRSNQLTSPFPVISTPLNTISLFMPITSQLLMSANVAKLRQ